MRRLLVPIAILALALPAFAGRHYGSGHGFSINMDNDYGEVTDCSQIHVTYDGRDVPMITEDLPVGGLRSLKVHGDHNGGIHVSGGNAFGVRACKASALGDSRDIRVNLSGNEVTADRADDSTSVGYFPVPVPRGGPLRPRVNNGPHALRPAA